MLLGFVLGYFVSARGVAAAWAIALTIGSVILIYQASKEYSIPLKEKAGESLWVVITGLIFAFFPLLLPDYYAKHYTFVLIAYALWLVVSGYAYFKNIYKSYYHKFK